MEAQLLEAKAKADRTASVRTTCATDVNLTAASMCAVPGKDLHNNTIRILERSLQAAGTDGYADTESGTSSRCAVRVSKGLQRLEYVQYSHTISLR